MLKSLEIENFTVFLDAKIKWSPGLNVIVGENGTGKSQLMRLAYALSYVSSKFPQSPRQDKVALQRAVAEKIVAVCKPKALGRLISRQQGRGRCEIKVSFVESLTPGFSFSFATNSLEVKVDHRLHVRQSVGSSVFWLLTRICKSIRFTRLSGKRRVGFLWRPTVALSAAGS